MEAHTDLPVALPIRVNGSEANTAIWLEDANGKRVATIKSGPRDLDTANMLRDCCNAYDELLQICAEAYQVVGVLAYEAGRFSDDTVVKVLDNLSQQRLVHTDVLPFPCKPEAA